MSRPLVVAALVAALALPACSGPDSEWEDPGPAPYSPLVQTSGPALSTADAAICTAVRKPLTDVRQFQAVYLGILQLNGGIPDAKRNALGDLRKAMTVYATALADAQKRNPGPLLKAAIAGDVKLLAADEKAFTAAGADYDGKVKDAVVALLQQESISKVC